jgi:hypothetical protein
MEELLIFTFILKTTNKAVDHWNLPSSPSQNRT